MNFKKYLFLIFLLLFITYSLFSNNRKQASTYFNKAQKLTKEKKQQKALEYYIKAFKKRPDSGFYAARVGQHYYTKLKNYKKALIYYMKGFKLNFRNTWMLGQMIGALNWLAEFSLADNNLKKSLKYLSSATTIIKNTPAFKNKYLYIKQKYQILKQFSLQKNVKDIYTHKIVVILIKKINYAKNKIEIKHKITEQELSYSKTSIKTLKKYIQALTKGHLALSIKIKEWNNPIKSLKVFNAKKYVLDTEKLSLEIQSLISKDIPHTDTFIFIWPSGVKQNAHGGAAKYLFDNGKKKAWRGVIQIPSFRMPYNGPTLVLHEFFHVVENMAFIKPRHGYRHEIRINFPDWKGEGDLNYYYWQLSRKIPLLLRSKKFKTPGWHNMNFIKRYLVKNF